MSICRQYVEALDDAEVTTVFVQGLPAAEVEQSVGGAAVIFLEKSGEDLRGIKFSQILRLHKLLGLAQFDAVIAHRYKGIYLAGILSYFRDFPVLLGVAHEHRVFNRITRKLFVTFWRKQFRIAGVSDTVCSDIADRCPSVLAEDRLFHLPNVLPAGFNEALIDKEAAREQLGLAAGDYVIGSVGRLIKKKCLHVLIDGFKRYLLAHSENAGQVKLVLMGDGPLRSELARQITELGLETQVKLLGHVPNAGRLVRALDLFVLPSGEAEAFGLVLLEAMAAKVPVISSNAPGPSEVHGTPRWQFEMNDTEHLANRISEWRALSADQQRVVISKNQRRVEEAYSPQVFRRKLELALER